MLGYESISLMRGNYIGGRDKFIRKDKHYQLDKTVTLNCKIRFGSCKGRCRWNSVVGQIQAYYEVFFEPRDQLHYVYITMGVYKQQCKSHSLVGRCEFE